MAKQTLSTTVEAWKQSNYLITISLSADDKIKMRDKILIEYQKDATKPWFRKGHVPLAMVEQMLNPGAIMMASIEEFVNRGINEAIQAHPEYKWIGQPYNLDTSKYEDEKNPSLTWSLDVYPEVVVKDDKRKKIKKSAYSTEVTQSEVDATVEQLRSSYANFEDAAEIADEVLTRAKVTYLHKGTQVGNTKNQYIWWEEVSPNKDLTKALLGKKIGDIISLDYKKVQDVSVLTYATSEGDQPTEITLEILDTKKKVLPELNQEFINKVFTKEDNISSVDVLMEKIKETLSTNKANDALYNWINEYLVEADGSFGITIPQTLVDEEMKNRLEHFSKQLGGEKGLQAYLQRMGEEASKKYLEDIKQSGITSMRRFFVMKYITEELKLDIDRTKQTEEGVVEKMLYDKVVA
jgi:trigger factor